MNCIISFTHSIVRTFIMPAWSPNIMIMYFNASVPRADLLHGPPVPVRIAEEYEPDVVERIVLARRAYAVRAEHLDPTRVDATLDELCIGRPDVADDELQALERSRLHASDPLPDDHGA